ncbi:iron uptake system protein EfeO [Streptococcus entericus]|uniref:iron uptake system protein EfeO n=1 Tax=Streptococcus entericus TaxID=155680 RepID=UPI000361594A|nr:iron uptake system protein EfeO [Streptococcus entericus]
MKRIFSYSLLSVSVLSLVACTTPSHQTAPTTATTEQVSANQTKLSKITTDYRIFVEQQIDQLLTDTEKWAELLKAGKLEEAKAQYPLIRMAYERSEPIAESFGELDVRIDFRLVDYVDENNTEEGWSGFHRIERILWEGSTTEGTEVFADQLVKDIKELRAKVATVDVTPDMMTAGAVDLLNEVATSKITGEEEIYSHTDLYDFRANIEGAEKIFDLFRPLLQEKSASLVEDLEVRFADVHALLDSHMTNSTNYKSYTDLTKEDTRALSEAVTKLGEPLSQMGIVIE